MSAPAAHPVGDAVPEVTTGAEEACGTDASGAAGEEMEWWVRSIRENVSAEDLRGIRLRRSTIEAATARLGGGRRGTMQLLKLILVWVRQNRQHLQRKRPRVVKEEEEEAAVLHGNGQLSSCPGARATNPGQGYEFPAAAQDMAAAAGGGTSLMPRPRQRPFTPPAAYGGEAVVYPSAAGQYPFHLQSSSKSSVVVNRQPLPPRFGGQYAAASRSTMAAPQHMAGVEASATKEAPKKQQQQVPPAKPVPGARQQVDSPKRLAARQVAKADKNLRFLLQRELKQSDVDLGRIVLPRMEAQVHLPELKTKYGISIPMEDMGTSRVWKMRYKCMSWPNNRSRIYVLGNTGEFVRSNGLKEGDFIVIYSNVKSGKYLIQGVKVRPSNTSTDIALLAHLVGDISKVDFDEADLDTKICDLVASARKSSEVEFDDADLDTKICDLVASARKSQSSSKKKELKSKKKELRSRDVGNIKF